MPSRRDVLAAGSVLAVGMFAGCLRDGRSDSQPSAPATMLQACPDSPTVDLAGPPSGDVGVDTLALYARRVERAVLEGTLPDDRGVKRIERSDADPAATPPTVSFVVELRRASTPTTPAPADAGLHRVTYRLGADRVIRVRKGYPASLETGRDCWTVVGRETG